MANSDLSETYIEATSEISLWLSLWALLIKILRKEVETMTCAAYRASYIKRKCKILKHFGLKDSAALKQYLQSETAHITDMAKMEIRVDNLCRTLILNYYNGDKTFCKEND